ncbi:MAG: hypothetical protein Q9209_002207 [Squamulea sp. 1 TL-2023]
MTTPIAAFNSCLAAFDRLVKATENYDYRIEKIVPKALWTFQLTRLDNWGGNLNSLSFNNICLARLKWKSDRVGMRDATDKMISLHKGPEELIFGLNGLERICKTAEIVIHNILSDEHHSMSGGESPNHDSDFLKLISHSIEIFLGYLDGYAKMIRCERDHVDDIEFAMQDKLDAERKSRV